LFQFRIALPQNLIQPDRLHPCFLKLREWPACFHGLVLSRVSHQ
jgi:hypothetical protein